MPITREEFNEVIQQLGTCEDETERRTILATLSNNVADEFDKIDDLTNSNNQLTEDNKKLQNANMELFLQVGSRTPQQARQDVLPEEQPKEKLKFEDLFNENGGLK